MNGIVIVGCGQAKRDTPQPARDLYTGDLFRAARRAAEALAPADGWYILSAKHGLISPGDIIDPHDLRIGSAGSVAVSTLRGQAEQLGILPARRVLVYVGPDYLTPVRGVWPHAVCPFYRLPNKALGFQLQLLSRVARTGDPWGTPPPPTP